MLMLVRLRGAFILLVWAACAPSQRLLAHCAAIVWQPWNARGLTGAMRSTLSLASCIVKPCRHRHATSYLTLFTCCLCPCPPREQVALKYKKKIELMVRKPDKEAEEAEEALVRVVVAAMSL